MYWQSLDHRFRDLWYSIKYIDKEYVHECMLKKFPKNQVDEFLEGGLPYNRLLYDYKNYAWFARVNSKLDELIKAGH